MQIRISVYRNNEPRRASGWISIDILHPLTTEVHELARVSDLPAILADVQKRVAANYPNVGLVVSAFRDHRDKARAAPGWNKLRDRDCRLTTYDDDMVPA